MARHLHLDPFGGLAGDMFLGLLLDLGLPETVLAAVPARLGLEGVSVRTTTEHRGAIVAGRVHVVVRGHEEHAAVTTAEAPAPRRAPAGARFVRRGPHDHAHPHPHDHAHDHAPHGAGRTLGDVLALLAGADLPERARALASDAIRRLFAAEALVHGTPIDEVHLHEAGADDALVDIAGTALGLVELGIESVSCSVPIPVGGGSIHCAHGILPVPGPAVAELLRGVAIEGGPVARELVTPTGAAILRAITGEFRALPSLTLERAGHGAGARNDAALPSVLRGILGTREAGPLEREVAVLECALDDVLPQDVPVLIERLLAAGARDAMVTPVQMKKGRPGFLLTVVCDPADERRLAALILRESPTLGVRGRRESRLEWARDAIVVESPWGPVRVKRALDSAGRVLRGQPEFEDCRRAADAAGVPVDDVREAARRGYAASTEPEKDA